VKALHLGAALLCAAALVGCSEKPQAQGSKKVGLPEWAGADPRYSAPGWKAGDATQWEQHLRNRARLQNEYERTGGAAKAPS
jgi:hypothetical protein